MCLIPSRVFLSEAVEQVACGDNMTLALTRTGIVYGWGSADTKQLTSSYTDDVWVPVKLPFKLNSDQKVAMITAGEHDCAAVSSNGDVYVWGYTLGDHPRVIESLQKQSFKCGMLHVGWNHLIVAS
eukprot:TRINITY_DN9707_c0_g1_i1.p1 TRINITY_DN9707_c0_g1~~TRINITY_DN9707_c0_g1_i1.p1  ORF type:complete len:126 (-),score=17.11 TRINITY_DN9707_c0_g1_i1:21-398(-)